MGRLSWRAGGALLLFLCIAVAGAAALTAGEIDISPGTLQITAGESGTIGVTVNNATVKVEKVTFTYQYAGSEPSGTLSVTSDSLPPYQTVFYSEKAGDRIQISVQYLDTTTGLTQTIDNVSTVRVIPADPYAYISTTYEGVISANETTPITVRMKDKYDNVINDETGATVDFWVSVDGAEFKLVDGSQSDDEHIAVPFAENGDCTVLFHAPVTGREVIIGVYPGYGKSLDKLITINVMGERVPVEVIPSIVTVPYYSIPFYCIADGTSYFRVSYIVNDRFGNGISDYPVDVSTSIGESITIYTDASGYATMNYGPRTAIGTVTIWATTGGVDALPTTLYFTGGTAEGFELTVNPSNIPSADTDPSAVSAISARVSNIVGTGVVGENVEFRIKSGSITNNTDMTADPFLTEARDDIIEFQTLTVETDDEGYATVYLHAGAFPEHGEDGFNPYALGKCIVTITWEGQSKETYNISWRNYPYLRVETTVSADVVAPGDPLDVTIHLIGDGNNYNAHDQINVVLCLDRGEDMLISEGALDRMEIAREAAMYLVRGGETDTSLDPTQDGVALITYSDDTTDTTLFEGQRANILDLPVTFQWKKDVGQDGNKNDDEGYISHYPGHDITQYLSYATLDYGFHSGEIGDWDNLSATLNNVVPVKKDDSGQASAPLRLALAKSIQYLEDNPTSPEPVKAIVLLMQNNYRYFGDPFAEGAVMEVLPDSNTLAKGGGTYYNFLPYDKYLGNGATVPPQNMVEYAKANGVKIYAIYYPSGGSVSDEAVPKRLAHETGGEYYFAGDEAALEQAFKEIYAALMREAGIHTSVNLTFAELPDNINYTATTLLTYDPETYVDFFNWTTDPYGSGIVEDVDHLDDFYYSVDQTDMWEATGDYAGNEPGTLQFEVGNVSVKQTWMTKFTLRINASVSEPINFTLFAPGSIVEFENNEGMVISEIIPAIIITVIPGLTPQQMFNASIEVPYILLPEQNSMFATFNWPIIYDGVSEITETFSIRRTDGEDNNWKTIGTMNAPFSCTGDTIGLYTVDLDWGEYEARIKVWASDAGYDEAALNFNVTNMTDRPYIRLT